MKLSEFYEKIGQDYNEMLDRMVGKKELLMKFLKKYPNDPSFEMLEQAVATGNLEQIFRAAHTLKGVASNLGLKPVVDIVSPFVETTRGGSSDGVEETFSEIKKAHREVLAMIENVE